MTNKLSNIVKSFLLWFDANQDYVSVNGNIKKNQISWLRCFPFLGVHLACIAVIWVGWSWSAIAIMFTSYFIRMFAITGFYHRYFAHRSFKTNRFWQFIFALLGASAAQRGPLWWAGHHRHHHQYSDTNQDSHSPITQGFWWSHIGWFICEKNFHTPNERIKDFIKYPELRFLNRFDTVIPIIYATLLFGFGQWLAEYFPSLNTNGPQLLIWGFFISTVVLFHATFSINSLGHLFGKQRYQTEDDSKNNAWLALITLGEGWHNNHHRWPIAARQGFFWWEIDITYYLLKCLSWLKIISDLKPVPQKIMRSYHA